MKNIRIFLSTILLLVVSGVSAQTVNRSFTTGATIGSETVTPSLAVMASDNDATNAISLAGNLTINGNVIFGALPNCKLKIDLGALTRIRPSAPNNTNIEGGFGYGHLILYAGDGAKVTVNVNHDLTFTGTNPDGVGLTRLATMAGDLNLTFSGAGQVEFVVVDGKTISLTSLYESEPGTFAATSDAVGSGVRGVILMDHDDTRVWQKGVNKVVVSRKITTWDPESAEMQNDITFSIGHNSFLTFGSINKTGLNPTSAEGISANETTEMLSAALAFDVSCAGPGRTILKIEGMSTANTYRDGALTIGGNLIDDGSGGVGSLSNATHIRSNLRLHKPAGGQAFLRVTDEKAYSFSAYATAMEDALTSYLDNASHIPLDEDGNPTTRGLWIINTNNSHPAMAANSFSDMSWFSQEIFNAGKGRSSIRPGFVLAINGQLSIYHNTFVHHLACKNTRAIDPSASGMAELASMIDEAENSDYRSIGATTKKHNPSAFIIDGYSSYVGGSYLAYKGDTRAKITLWGAAQLYVSSGANASGTVTADYTIGTGTYNGSYVPITSGMTSGEGEHVLDIQGLSAIRSFMDSAVTDTTVAFSRHEGSMIGKYRSVTDDEGETTLVPQPGGIGGISIGSVKIDYTGTPLRASGAQIASWPLLKNATYKLYNRGCINVNNDVTLRYARLNHFDVGRDVVRDYAATSPAIVGGEYAVYASRVLDNDEQIPVIWLENAQLRCHESMCVSGVRFAVKEQINLTAPFIENNSSSIYLYNHGDELDMNIRGYGRVFQLGSQVNKLAGGATTSLLQSAYANAFRHIVDETTVELALDTFVDDGVLNLSERAFQLVHLANDSNLSLGWTSTQGIISRSSGAVTTTVYPWHGTQVPVIGTGWSLFSLDAESTARASLKINGELIHISASAEGGATPPTIVSNATMGGVVYVNHGAQITAGDVTNSSGLVPPYTPTAAIDVPVALRVAQSTLNTYNPMGTLTVPFDQINLLKGVQPYNIDTDFAAAQDEHVNLSFQLRTDGLSSGLTIPWNVVKKNVTFPFKNISFSPEFERAFSGIATRSVGVQTTAISMPTSGLLKFGAGVSLEQLAISGATSANPIGLYLTGDGTNYSIVREIVSVPSTSGFVPGEGSYAAIYMDKDAFLGLGQRNWNDKSVNAWNMLGRSRVTLVANGDCFIELNEDIILSDAQPIIPTTNFGATRAQRITFFSQDPREIRIPRGGEFDLSAFGSLTNGTNQQITFDGNIRLIFEAGSTLRFPAVGHSNNTKGPVLYMNGKSQIIFEGLSDRDTSRIVNRNVSAVDFATAGRSRIVGVGKIWLNKSASMKIMESACVGIEGDSRALETDILISIAREGSLLLGDQNSAGGILQVGNVADLSSGGDVLAGVYLTLRINGPRSIVHMDRESYLGFGAGVLNRNQLVSGSLQNSLNNMKLKALFNVKNVAIRAARGSFSHNQIYDGRDSQASLLAFGPSTEYTLDLGVSAESIWRGGGNMIYVTESATVESPLQVSVLSSAQPLADEYNRNTSGEATTVNSSARSGNNGKISIMGSGVMARQLTQTTLPYPGPVRVVREITSTYLSSIRDSDNGSAPTLLGGKNFTGPQADMFRYLAFTPFEYQEPSKYSVLGSTQFEFKIGYVIGTTITRTTTIPMLGDAKPEGAAKVGALLVEAVDSSGNPALYGLPEVPNNPPMLFIAS
ncbi:hypothetical protein FJ366_00995 [Candidatus Dependentiae bacterium]|nr:hypothetical protein [Candidatus Dependentiae bacterium]